MDGSGNWESFVNDHLLSNGTVTGVSLLSQQGACLYSMGALTDFHKISDAKQLLRIFNPSQTSVMRPKLNVYVTGQGTLNFQVHKQTNCSLYAASVGSHVGLLVGNLPYGVLVCTHLHQEPYIARARKQFEHVCGLLRS
ncbi:uncharacterized protein [Diadema antillarum]|uniref:uncharacterized protein n=1 Tax=Diadema antillarum TaxID=105358 RepID=UPI003A836219